MIACSSILLLASCSKKNEPQPEPVGAAKVRFVNTVRGSLAQDFYVNGVKKSTLPAAYGEASAYLEITSGSNAFKFYDAGTTTVKAESQAYSVPIGFNVTTFYYQGSNGLFGAFAIGDDMSAPAAGKAKVRFYNLNSFLTPTTGITISVVGQTTPLIPSLVYGDLNATYYAVDPGAKFTLTAAGVTNAPQLDGGIIAGKNYTIWIDGGSSAELTGHVILQN